MRGASNGLRLIVQVPNHEGMSRDLWPITSSYPLILARHLPLRSYTCPNQRAKAAFLAERGGGQNENGGKKVGKGGPTPLGSEVMHSDGAQTVTTAALSPPSILGARAAENASKSATLTAISLQRQVAEPR
eukprot:scaffold719_cov226-Pinguiococcus_pyrenoidosus.AAC.6